MKLEDQTAVVTGGGSGIGRGIALALAGRGAKVVVADVERERAASVAAEIREVGGSAEAFGCDVADESSVGELADFSWSEFGRVDMVFNNAGVVAAERGLGTSRDDIQWLFEVNVFGVWNGCRVFGRRFIRQETPCWICNTASEHALGVPSGGQPLYAATKHAVLGFSDVLRRDLPDHVGISVLCPGIVNTDIWDAGRNRPHTRGGPVTGPEWSRHVMTRGMDAREVGLRTVAGVEAEEFLIVTHPHDMLVAEERWMDIRGAFERQAPPGAETDRDESARVIREVVARVSGGDRRR